MIAENLFYEFLVLLKDWHYFQNVFCKFWYDFFPSIFPCKITEQK